MSTVDYIFSIVIFHICMSLFESTLLSFCKLQSKLDLPTLRQGSRERKNATKQMGKKNIYSNNKINIFIYIPAVHISYSLLPKATIKEFD